MANEKEIYNAGVSLGNWYKEIVQSYPSFLVSRINLRCTNGRWDKEDIEILEKAARDGNEMYTPSITGMLSREFKAEYIDGYLELIWYAKYATAVNDRTAFVQNVEGYVEKVRDELCKEKGR